MTEELIKFMEDIDHKAQVGLPIEEWEKEKFNKHFKDMLEHVESEYEHWKHHSYKFNNKNN